MYFLLLFILYIGILGFFILHKRVKSISTTSGATVMAMGIMLIGMIQKSPLYTPFIGYLAVTLLFCLYGAIIAFISTDVVKKTFYDNHAKNPINSFAIGTWVASTSVVCLNLHYYFSSLVIPVIVFYCIGFIIWIWYLWIITRNFSIIMKKLVNLTNLHGVILLSCVSTQSLVIAGARIFGEKFSLKLELGMLGIGLLFYVIGMVFIIKCYWKDSFIVTLQNWKNTNCIIHGALSITGLAACITMQFLNQWLIYFWLVVTFVFIIVECFELVRMTLRIKQLGIINGLFVYHPTQWARNFTFGMYINFTMHLPKVNMFENARFIIVEIGIYIVVLLFAVEVLIFMRSIVLSKTRLQF